MSRRHDRSARGTILILVLLTLLPRVAVFARYQPWRPEVRDAVLLTGDALGYHQLALRVFSPEGFYPPGDPSDTLRPPLYPIFLALIYKAFGAEPWKALLVQIVLSAAIAVVLYLAVRRALGSMPALFAGVAFALDPFLVILANSLLTETFFLFLLSCCLYGLARLFPMAAARGASIALLGASLGLATLARPSALFAPVVVALAILFWMRGDVRRRLAAAAAVVAIHAAVLAPWLLRNKAVYGVASLSIVGEYNLLVKLVIPHEAARGGETIPQVHARLLEESKSLMRRDGFEPESLNDFRQAPYWRDAGMVYVRRDPVGIVGEYGRQCVLSFVSLGTGPISEILRLGGRPANMSAITERSAQQGGSEWMRRKSIAAKAVGGVVALWLALTYGLTLLGLVRGWQERNRVFLAVCLATGLLMLAVNAGGGEARFRLAALPFQLPFLGLGAAYLWSRARAIAGLSR